MIRQSGIKVSADVNKMEISKLDFLEAEELGVEPPRRCKKCRGCTLCSFRGFKHTEKESLEYKTIEGVKHDPENNVFQVSYAFLEDPKVLSDNLGQVIKIAESEEKK